MFESLNGVSDVVSGYAGGQGRTAHYEQVGTGGTGHAESVKITYDPARITYGQLLKVFFAVAHDPTEVNRQGPDEGPQYRSEIFYATDDQKAVAEAYVSPVERRKGLPSSDCDPDRAADRVFSGRGLSPGLPRQKFDQPLHRRERSPEAAGAEGDVSGAGEDRQIAASLTRRSGA